jgi:hypothetical protein
VVDNRRAAPRSASISPQMLPDGYALQGRSAHSRSPVTAAAKLPAYRAASADRIGQPRPSAAATAPALPVTSVKELIDYAKKNPGKLSNASSSNGSPGHVGGELFKYMTGTDILHVPYKGGAQAINDLIAGHVDLMFESLNSISSTAKADNVRALAVSGPRRSPAFPDLPTIGETVPGYDAGTWSGVIAPAGLPKPILDKLNAAINRAISLPAFKERFGAIGDEPAGGSAGNSPRRCRLAKWADVVLRSGRSWTEGGRGCLFAVPAGSPGAGKISVTC